MNDIKYFDKVIPKLYSDQIESDLLQTQFPWHYISDVTSTYYGNNSGFVHVVYDHGTQPSEWYPFLKPIVYSIAEANGTPIEKLFRIRIGMLLKTDQPEHACNTPHVDFLWPHYTACYYVNDSDGDTILYDKTLADVDNVATENDLIKYVDTATFTEVARGAPKKGSVCIFDGLRFHSSTKPRDHDRRLVITINYV